MTFRGGRRVGGTARWRAIGDDEADRQPRQLGCRRHEPRRIAVRGARFECDGFPVDIAGLAHRIPERLPDRAVVDDADAGDLVGSLLGVTGVRRGHEAAENRDEVAPPHGCSGAVGFRSGKA
jgi:hypothetical protein